MKIKCHAIIVLFIITFANTTFLKSNYKNEDVNRYENPRPKLNKPASTQDVNPPEKSTTTTTPQYVKPPEKSTTTTPQYVNPPEKSTITTTTTPQYVKPPESNPMKTATIVQNEQQQPELFSKGLTERPNFLSSVITSAPTNVMTPSHYYAIEDGIPSYDLDEIKKKHYFEQMANAKSPINPNFVQFGGDNMIPLPQAATVIPIPPINSVPLVGFNQNPAPPIPTAQKIVQQIQLHTTPLISHPQFPANDMHMPPIVSNLIAPGGIVTKPQIPIIDPNSKTYDIKINYQGQVAHQEIIPPNMLQLENQIKNIENLTELELTNLIHQLKEEENYLTNQNEMIYTNLKKYEAQNNVILDTIMDDIAGANNNLKQMIVEVPDMQRQVVNSEIEDEFSRSLEGYNIIKSKYPHLKDLDPKELFDLSTKIKQELDKNENFYLHGDFNFYQ